jgi:sulfide:quinone oxidoreductase
VESSGRFKVVIAGGGVAALEAALTLRELAGARVETVMLAPEPEFVYRPMTVLEPFGLAAARRYPLDEIARDIGVQLRTDAFDWLDAPARVVHTADGGAVSYDALLLAMGARRYERFRHALTLDDSRLDEQLHGLIQDVEGDYVSSVAFLIPSRIPWPMPIYELALMTAARADDMNIDLTTTVITPEPTPLAVFGDAASEAVARLLSEHGIRTITSARCEVPAQGRVAVHPDHRDLEVDRIVALPELYGPSTPGVPGGPRGGFIPVDPYGQVKGLERVYAAGDATDFPVKLGGLAAQQADTAGGSIAALAGAEVEPTRFSPSIEGFLLGGRRPLHMTARLVGGRASNSEVSEAATRRPEHKISARRLAPYLDARDETLSAR